MMEISITKPMSHLFDRSLSKPLIGCTSVDSGSTASGSIGASTLDSAYVGGDSVGFRDVLIRNPF